MDFDTHGKTDRADKPLTRTDVMNLLRQVDSTRELDLSDQNLSGIDLSNFDLTGATLNWAELSNANLSGTNLNEADLLGADLRKANLSGAKLHKAILRDAILNTDSQQEKTSLSKINQGWVILCRLNLKMKETDLRRIDLSEANLNGADLHEADLRGSNLRKASLIEANLRDAKLSKANLKGAFLSEAELGGADLSETDLSEADLSGAFLGGADLRKANLSGADLHQATLTKVNLKGALLNNTNLCGADLSETDLSEADLSGADLREANLIEANLRDAKLSKANLKGAYISRYLEASLRSAGVIDLDEKPIFVEGMVSSLTIHIRILEEPLTSHNLASIISALTEFTTKCWLISTGRLADLIEYTQTHNIRFAEEAHTIITKVTYNSPLNIDWTVDISAPSVAEAIVTTIDGITQRKAKLVKSELENQAKAQAFREAEQKAEQEQQLGLLEQEKQRLEIEGQRLALLEQRLEVQKKGIEFALEIACKTVDVLHPNADAEARTMLIQTLLPNILQLQNGKGLELALPPPKHDEEKMTK